jgi:hypothetical protein
MGWAGFHDQSNFAPGAVTSLCERSERRELTRKRRQTGFDNIADLDAGNIQRRNLLE